MQERHPSRGSRPNRPLPKRPALVVLMLVVLAGSTAFSGLVTGARAATARQGVAPRIPALAIQQINALQAEKRGRSAAQRKVAAPLLYAAKQSRGAPIAAGIAGLRT